MPSPVADIFAAVAAANRGDARRRGNVVHVESGRTLIVAGDIHGNRANLDRILRYAALRDQPQRVLVLQELIHGPADEKTGCDRSIELLMRVARLQVELPGRIICLMGNHDLTQASGAEILKDGRGVCREFTAGIAAAFGDDAPSVTGAVNDLLLSCPLAIATPGGVMISHSLPTPGAEAAADVLDRDLTAQDFARGGAVYQWLWGRRQNRSQIDQLAAKLNVNFFVLGHRHMEGGFELFDPQAVALSSDSQFGCVMEFSSDEMLTADAAQECLKPITLLG
ncbi:MAG: metallophosphoesterase [Planctomycetaceae bacterium]|nr:metallophosphoesterase [Planctomycetaceae bacterium]